MSARELRPALVVVGAGVAAALHVGKLPAALPVLRDALGIGLVEAGFLLSLVQFAGMLLGLLTGLAADAAGLKRTMMTGLALLASASAFGSMVHTGSALLAWRALEGLGFLLATMPAPSLIRRLVDASRVNTALGLWGAYMPLGTAIALLASAPAISTFGWRGWWLVLAAIAATAAWFVWRALPSDPMRPREHRAPGGSAARLRRTLGTRGAWWVALSFAVYSAQWLSVIGFLPTVYAQAGLAAGVAGAATALAALVNMVGNVAAGRMMQRGVQARYLLVMGFVTMSAGALMTFAGSAPFVLRYAGVLAFSMVGGLIPGTLFSLAVRLAPGDDTVSTTVGWMQQWSAIGQFAGPPVVAFVASHVGGWQWSGAVTSVCAVAGLVLAGAIARELRSAGH